MNDHKRFPLNVAGDFYVEDGVCMACTAPELEAPDLIAYSPSMHCYFKRQPKTSKEVEAAVLAVVVSCCGGVRYGGNDRDVIRQIVDYGEFDKCDQL